MSYLGAGRDWRIRNYLIGDEEAVDPLFSSVLLLLHGNGANFGTSFPDSGPYHRDVQSIPGMIVTSTDQFVFNGSSMFGGAAGSGFLTLAVPQLAGRDWTFEGFIRRLASFDRFGVIYFGTSGNLLVRVDGIAGASTFRLEIVLNGAIYTTSLSALPTTEFAYFAISCAAEGSSNTRIRFYIGGQTGVATLISNTSSGDSSWNLSNYQVIQIGRNDAAGFYQWAGYVAEYRLTVATRYTTATIPVPSTPFPNCCGSVVIPSSAWSPVEKGANVVISPDQTTASLTAADGMIIGVQSRNSTEDRCFDLVFSGEADVRYMGGIARTGVDLGQFPGFDSAGYGHFGNATRWHNSINSAYGTAYVAPITITVQLKAGDVIFWRAGVSQGVAFTVLAGDYYPAWGTASAAPGTRSAQLVTSGGFLPPGSTYWG